MRSAPIGLILLAFAALPSALVAQGVASDHPLGLKLVPVPDALYAHLHVLKSGQGLLVDAVKPGSRAAELGFKQYDVLLTLGATSVKNVDELHNRLAALKPGERELLQIIRQGKEFALTLTSPAPARSTDDYSPPKSLFKPGGPPAVSVEIKPLPRGGMEVNLFYLNKANKMDRRALHGSLEEIEHQVSELARQDQMPANIHDLVSLALERLRAKNQK